MRPKPDRLKSSLLTTAVICMLVLALAAGPARAADSARLTPGGLPLSRVLADLEAGIIDHMAAQGVPGLAAAVVWNNELVFCRGFGVTEAGGHKPVNGETIFQIGSQSKAFTAVLTAKVVESGLAGWDDPVIDHLSGFALSDADVTQRFAVRDLMAQHSGLPTQTMSYLAMAGYDRRHIVQALSLVPLTGRFRVDYAYQNILFLVAAQMVEKHTGQSWEVSLERSIFRPLDMDRSSPGLSPLLKDDNAAWVHIKGEQGPVPLPRHYPSLRWTDILGPAGGVCSTAADMARWARMLLNRGSLEGRAILRPDSVDYLFSPATFIINRNGIRMEYCQAWVRETGRYNTPLIWHNGDTIFSHGITALVPEHKLGVILLGNLGGNAALDKVAVRFTDVFMGREKPKTTPAVSSASAKGPQKANPSGRWANSVYDLNIFRVGEKLKMEVGPWKTAFDLTPDKTGRQFQVKDGFFGSSIGRLTWTPATEKGRPGRLVLVLNDDPLQGEKAQTLYRK